MFQDHRPLRKRRYGAPGGRADCVAHFEESFKTGKLKNEAPATVSRLRGTDEHPTLDVTDELIRMILDQVLFNDWAYRLCLRVPTQGPGHQGDYREGTIQRDIL